MSLLYRLDGHVSYQILVSGEGGIEAVSDRFEQVTSFINSENDPNFSGATWMLVATWYNVHPDPHGDSAEQDREDPYLESVSGIACIRRSFKPNALYHSVWCVLIIIGCFITDKQFPNCPHIQWHQSLLHLHL